MSSSIAAKLTLESRLRELELENQKLRAQLAAVKHYGPPGKDFSTSDSRDAVVTSKEDSGKVFPHRDPLQEPTLSLEEFKRYGRQMIVPSIGMPGQLRLKSSSVLIVGAGGLGCPAAAYIASAGIGALGICDGDIVEMSNLHRQIAHATERVGRGKVESMVEYLKGLNPNVKYVKHKHHLTPDTAASIFASYDLILDCTDHPSPRYLISDTCVLLSKPLISASALRTEGQLLVLNYPPGNGACYRCIWPKPPPPESVLSCGEGGIVGPVVGAMGVLMAVEALKIVTNPHETSSSAEIDSKKPTTPMLLYSAYSDPPFRTLKLRGKKRGCIACLAAGRIDYVTFCGVRKEDCVREDEKVDVGALKKVMEEGKEHCLIDVREKVEWEICRLGGINVPISQFLQDIPLVPTKSDTESSTNPPLWLPENPKTPIYIVCKQGNDSQVAVKRLKAYLASVRRRKTEEYENKNGGEPWEGGIWDVRGGLKEWRRLVDGSFPEY
ncbi:hypothetical protein BDZ91DRAFT_708190 [Kalaharituber pfeilii]|nr:hypothetical protein BDZ91DRAFT_708190 [Kalaharituber pfeilii]